MSYLKLLLEIAKALPTIFDLYRKWEISKLRREQEKEALRRKDEIDKAVESGNTLPLEEALGSVRPGRPATHQDGVQQRPSRGPK